MSKEPSEEEYSKAAELKAAALEAASTGMSFTAGLKHVRALTKPFSEVKHVTALPKPLRSFETSSS
jgi:N-acyl-D-aspartate/D-glutamate deacylase